MGKSPKPKADNVTGSAPIQSIAGDRIVVTCRKHGTWETYRMSGQHHGYKTVARMNAHAVLEQGYKNVRS